MEQEKLKQILKDMIDESENNNITTIQDMIELIAIEMGKAQFNHGIEL